MLLATTRHMIEIGDTEANLVEKEWFALVQFPVSSENFNSGYGHDSNRNYISVRHYNQQDRFLMKASRHKEKIPMFQLYN